MRHDNSSLSTRRGRSQTLFVLLCCVLTCSIPLAKTYAASPRVVISPVGDFTIAWDGNNGGFSSPDAGAGPSNNVALASNGTVPFTSSDYGATHGLTYHQAVNLNDGIYGNSHSWISDFTMPDPNPFGGLRFAAPVDISSIAWGRDNGDITEPSSCGGTCTDRSVGTYTLQVTSVPSPDANTAETEDPSTGWVTVGTIQYLDGANDINFSAYLRHRYDLAQLGSPIAGVTGLRIKVSDPNMDIDEIEVNPLPDPIPPISNFIEITPATGFSINWDHNEGKYSTPNSPAPVPVNDASTNRGATPFTSSDLGPLLSIPFHRAVNLNDGFYGNSHSWISANGIGGNTDPNPFAGINFGRQIALRNIAWSRCNGDSPTFTDRTHGTYVIQVTTVPNPGVITPEACGPTLEGGWVTIGTINYKSDDPSYFTSYLRHRFDVAQGGNAIPATGIRIIVPNGSTDIDEIEVNANAAIEQNSVAITNASGLSIVWDGNDGQFNNPASGAAPPDNRALATHGTIPFTSSDLGPVLSIPYHRAVNLNDGLYGNNHSWISANGIGGTSDPDPFAGLNFGGTVSITNIAWGRDNGDAVTDACGAACGDRTPGTYKLQYTTVAAPDATTADTGDPSTGWTDIGTITYGAASPPFFTPYLRHRFDVSVGGAPIDATGIRIKVPDGSTDIDEIEINSPATAPTAPGPVGINPAAGYSLVWDGNDGHYFDPASGAAPPPNRALATEGTTPFTSSDFGAVVSIPYHRAVDLNDGLYGNNHSWISDFTQPDPNPFAGLSFGATIGITNIAWSRDNGDAVTDACGAACTDRNLGTYTLQVTTVPAPDATTAETGDPSTGWTTIGTVEYRRSDPPAFNSYLRHRFDVSSSGAPIDATGLRIKVPDSNTDIDEIEVNTAAVRAAPKLQVSHSGTDGTISWSGGGGLEMATSVNGPWTCIQNAVSPYPITVDGGYTQFYRVRR